MKYSLENTRYFNKASEDKTNQLLLTAKQTIKEGKISYGTLELVKDLIRELEGYRYHSTILAIHLTTANEAWKECLDQLDSINNLDKQERVILWAHLCSEHSGIFNLNSSLEDLLDIHQHEHNGPGGIRNHDEALRNFSYKKLGEVLSEAEYDEFVDDEE